MKFMFAFTRKSDPPGYQIIRVKQVYNSRFRAVTMLASPVPRMCTKVYLWLRVLGIRLSAS